MLKITAQIQSKAKAKLDRVLLNLASLPKGPDKVKVGFPKGEVGSDIVQRAIWNEFGTRGSGKGFARKGKGGKVMGGFGGPIPERPFMRNAMRANRGKYQKAMVASAREILRAVGTGGSGAAAKRQVLGRLGAMAQGDIQAEITAMSSPPNSPVTIGLKGSSNPLIDTGEMRARVSWKVDEG